MADRIHPDDFIHRLRLDRRRCFVVTGRPREGKTHLAEQMARRYGGQRLDLLATFAADPDLAASVDTFTPRRCKAFLQSFATGDPSASSEPVLSLPKEQVLVLVDEMEFLWHRWDEAEKREFLTILKLWSKPAFFGVFLPPDAVIENFEMPDQDGHPRILSLHDLQAI